MSQGTELLDQDEVGYKSESVSRTSVSTTPVESAKRKTLSLGERLKVIDYLRGLVEPIVADSSAAAALVVSAGSKVDINWPQLKYMFDDVTLEEWKLGTKVHVKSADQPQSIEDATQRIASLEKQVEVLKFQIEDIHSRLRQIPGDDSE